MISRIVNFVISGVPPQLIAVYCGRDDRSLTTIYSSADWLPDHIDRRPIAGVVSRFPGRRESLQSQYIFGDIKQRVKFCIMRMFPIAYYVVTNFRKCRV
ncbi:hypothetical protein EMIT047CA2_90157 [Pseudomonas soli]